MNVTEVLDAPSAVEPATAGRTPAARTRRAARPLHVAIAVIAIAAVVAGSVMFDTDGAIWVDHGTWLVREFVPGVVTFAVVGVLVLRYPRAAAVGWVMLATAVSWGLSALFAGLFIQNYATGFTLTPEVQMASGFCWAAGVFLSSCVLPQLFPDGWLKGWFWRLLLFVSVGLFVALHAHFALINWARTHPRAPVLVTVEAAERLEVIQFYGCAAIVVLVMAERVRRGPRLVRQQVAPLAVVWLISLAIEELRYAEWGDVRSGWAFIATWLWPVAVALVIGYSVIQHRLWDTRLVVRRFVAYAVVVGALTLIFAGVYFAMLLALSSQAVVDRYRWLALLVAAVAVIAADPLRRRLRTTLERRLMGERGEPLRPLARLDALTSAGSAGEDEVFRTIIETVAEAVRAPGVALALHQPSGVDVVASTGLETSDHSFVVPLLHRGERMGELRVATRTPGESYGRRDRALLDQLANQAAALVYGLRRDTDIARLRNEAIEALVQQRITLGRDLHDGLAPLLAGAGLTADALRRGMPAGSPDAAEAARLATRLRTAATEVRRISHDLQPSPDTPRLATVITDYVASVTGQDAPVFALTLDDLAAARLPATTDLGLSRVALEAITNVVRHARATRAEITVRCAPDQIVLAVCDDGVGITQPYVSGLGITSMRSRVQALGGTFELTPGPDGGTLLRAQVPARR